MAAKAGFRIDPYIIALLACVGLAALFPASGGAARLLSTVTYFAICLLFFLYGARLSPKAILDSLLNVRLQSLILAITFIAFPLLGLALQAVLGNFLPVELSDGLLFLCLLPSTVQSSITFTSIARGSIPAAVCAASLSNIVGVLLTPLLVAALMHQNAGISMQAFGDIATQLLLPFILGQLARPLIAANLAAHKKMLSYVDRGVILLVVYSAFSAGMVAGIWQKVSLVDLGAILVICSVLLLVLLVATTWVSRVLGFSTEDEIAIVFCGSKKSMASGIPMAGILFPAATVSLIVLPLMLFHQIQLLVCAYMAQRYAERPKTEA